jgi:hypothetical protein
MSTEHFQKQIALKADALAATGRHLFQDPKSNQG